MSQTHLHFKLNQPHVVAENFGDEVIAIHLERGNYYSIEQSGAAIWSLATTGATVDEIITGIAQCYSGDLGDIQTTICQFLSELQQAELIVPSANGIPTNNTATDGKSALMLERQPFDPPILREYTDMQELLLLDPIHDVAEGGWPLKKSA